jgi:putative ABC transport system ATP-binding protein
VTAPDLFAFERVSVAGEGGVRILSDLSAGVPDGGITVVVGRSGSGKSTLLRLCNRLAVPASGRVIFRGADLAGLDPLQLRRSVGMVFQQPVPFGGSVRDNLRVAAPEADTDELLAALERAELPGRFLERPAGDLSGGEAQRMCLARTLVTGPQVLLMDEPTSALDRGSTRAIEGLARDLCRDGVPLVWVTHDLGQAMRLADWVVALADGALRWSGPRAELDGPMAAPERVEAGGRN